MYKTIAITTSAVQMVPVDLRALLYFIINIHRFDLTDLDLQVNFTLIKIIMSFD